MWHRVKTSIVMRGEPRRNLPHSIYVKRELRGGWTFVLFSLNVIAKPIQNARLPNIPNYVFFSQYANQTQEECSSRS